MSKAILVKCSIGFFAITVIAISVFLGVDYFSERSRFQELKAKAETGDSASQLAIGKYYLSKGDYRESILWLKKSADQKNDSAINQLGVLAYFLGGAEGTDESKELAQSLERDLQKYRVVRKVIDIYEDDLRNGNLERLNQIGEMYYFGEGVDNDNVVARGYFERSAAANVSNSPYSEYRLGEIYLLGIDVAENKQEALKWFEASCAHQNGQACEKLDKLRSTE